MQKINPLYFGYIIAFMSVLTNSSVYILSKLAFREVDLLIFGFYWFGFGLIWNMMNVSGAAFRKRLKPMNKSNFTILTIIVVLESIATYFFFTALIKTPNPGVVVFLGSLSPVFVTILAVGLLGERFNTAELIGILLSLAGALIISVDGIENLRTIFVNGNGQMIVSAIFYALATIIIKKNIRIIDVSVVTMNRSLVLFLISLVIILTQHLSVSVSPFTFRVLLAGSVLGPFFTVYLLYSSLRYIGASNTAVVSSARNVFVLLAAWMVFGTLPLKLQLIGGAISITGILLLSAARSRLVWIRRINSLKLSKG
ncbi:MAG: DMT family transporter [Bacteroidales bacterium]|nr:DMT family transporter [Bacteroidales bacterium]